jgi:hypothetical protein
LKATTCGQNLRLLPLQETGQIIEGKALQIQHSYATNIDLFDPDDPGWHFQHPRILGEITVEKPDNQLKKPMVPYCFRIDSLDTDSSIIICAGSAALPYGLVSSPESMAELYEQWNYRQLPILPLLNKPV